MQKIALIDMDHTLVDYETAMHREVDKIIDTNESKGWTERAKYYGMVCPDFRAARRELIWNNAGWWKNMPPLRIGALIRAILLTEGYKIVILTKAPYESLNAFTEKAEWCKVRFPEDTLLITNNRKDLVYGDIFVDDSPHNVEPWLNRWQTSRAILPVTPYNRGFDHPRAIYVNEQIYEQRFSALLKFISCSIQDIQQWKKEIVI
jgi:5'-nucleotidase